MNYSSDCGFCACNVTHKAERKWLAATCQSLENFFQEREIRTWLCVIATGLAKDRGTLIEQSLL